MRRMSSAAEFPRCTKTEVFARLADGPRAGVTIVTPNRRLALALKREFDDAQAGRGLAVWESADILPFPVFVERAYEDMLYSERGAGLPRRALDPMHERARERAAAVRLLRSHHTKEEHDDDSSDPQDRGYRNRIESVRFL